jgi:hypothetical protein
VQRRRKPSRYVERLPGRREPAPRTKFLTLPEAAGNFETLAVFWDFLPLYGGVVRRFEIFLRDSVSPAHISGLMPPARAAVSRFRIFSAHSARMTVVFRLLAVGRSASSIFFDRFRSFRTPAVVFGFLPS